MLRKSDSKKNLKNRKEYVAANRKKKLMEEECLHQFEWKMCVLG